jgi:hypothetical protein
MKNHRTEGKSEVSRWAAESSLLGRLVTNGCLPSVMASVYSQLSLDKEVSRVVPLRCRIGLGLDFFITAL